MLSDTVKRKLECQAACSTTDGTHFLLDALLDTGATDGCYISDAVFASHKDQFKELGAIRVIDMLVRVANGRTVRIHTAVSLTLTLQFPQSTLPPSPTVTTDFLVVNGLPRDLVIGLPLLTTVLAPCLISLLRYTYESYLTEQNLASISLADKPWLDAVDHLHPDSIMQPWSLPLDDEAPEELESPFPASVNLPPHIFNFLENTHAEAITEYMELLMKKVDPKLAAETPIMQLLTSDKALKQFVPEKWTGIVTPPVHIDFEGLPAWLHHRPRRVNPTILENVSNELNRLSGYFFVPSTSTISSSMVTAAKKTPPYVRLCGDYAWLSKHLKMISYPIPDVFTEIGKLLDNNVYIDMDGTNMFHQIPIDEETSNILSVNTHKGLFRPKFLPEGVGTASFILQGLMYDVFHDFIGENWLIVIFDNFLIAAPDTITAYNRFERFLHRCNERNVVLKLAKCSFGLPVINFFGYRIENNSYSLDDSRKATLLDWQFPKTKKQMQSYLGTSIFFLPFIPHYYSITPPLNDTLKTSYDWAKPPSDAAVQAFNALKEAMIGSMLLYFPDFRLDWILYSDASLRGVGAVLVQVAVLPDGTKQPQLIACFSKSFSVQAQKWAANVQECYAILAACEHWRHYLQCKHFYLRTDHANLQYIESSSNAKIYRWKVSLQSLSFEVSHVKGKDNYFSDMLSRHFIPTDILAIQHVSDEVTYSPAEIFLGALLDNLEDEKADICLVTPSLDTDVTQPLVDLYERFRRVHNSTVGHNSFVRTHALYNATFPEAKVPISFIKEMILMCPVCSKTAATNLKPTRYTPAVKTLIQPEPFSMLGIDTLEIGLDRRGNKYLIVIVNFFSHHADFYPVPDKTSNTLVQALISYASTFPLCKEIRSDPGPDLTSDVVKRVNELLGVKHSFSIANRHESTGVESTNKLILRHIRNMCLELNVRDNWSDPLYLQPLKFVLNTYPHAYTGVSPWLLTFGTDAFTNLPYPVSSSPDVDSAPTLVRTLDDHLKHLRDETKMFQDSLKLKLVAGRMEAELIPIGELVLLDTDVKHLRPQKLSASKRGPYQVHAQNSNNILLRDLVTDALFEAHIGKLSLFCGTMDQALHLARYDHQEFTVRAILSWQGDPFRRSEMSFQVQYTDGDKLWQPYREVVGLEAFDTFINLHPELHILRSNAASTSSFIRTANKKKPKLVFPYTCFVDLRIWGPSWYLNLGLPDAATTKYVIETRVTASKGATLMCSFPVLNYRQLYPYYYAHYWFTYKDLPTGSVLVTPTLVIAFPSLLDTNIAFPIPTELPSLQETDNFTPTVIPPTLTVSKILQRLPTVLSPTTPHQHSSPDDVNDEDRSS